MTENAAITATHKSPEVWIKSITFSDGTAIDLKRNDIVVIVGPNNSGKSASLRAIRHFLSSDSAKSPVVSGIDAERIGTFEDVDKWVGDFSFRSLQPNGDTLIQVFDISVPRGSLRMYWERPHTSLAPIARLFCHMLTADERLIGSNPASVIPLLQHPPTHPIHYLQIDDSKEKILSNQFKKAFGVDLIVHRNAGSEVPLLIGERPIPLPGDDRLSVRYLSELNKLDRIDTQGDGMRSFATMVLFTLVGRESILLIDEPEAFLHPPQARLLGQSLVSDKPLGRQLFISTHSGDVLRGILDANKRNVRVLRICRRGSVNSVKELSGDDIQSLWKDPLLRYSNILDGLFHERVIIGESDADARFYSAIMEASFDAKPEGTRRPDIMFTHCGGKDRLPLVIRALRAVGVPTRAVTDFDMLNNDQPLQRAVEASGGVWADVSRDWNIVKKAVDSKKPEWSPEQIKNEIADALSEVTAKEFPKAVKTKIDNAMKMVSPWSVAKTTGKTFVPSGDPSQALERLFKSLRQLGIWIVEEGEVEGFVRSIGGHGPHWVNEVLSGKDLATDRELDGARKFVAELIEQ